MTKYIDRYYLNWELYGIKFPEPEPEPEDEEDEEEEPWE